METLENLLNRIVRRPKKGFKITEDESNDNNEDISRVRDIIDPQKDLWMVDRSYIISHTGVQKLAQWVGAYWKEPKVISEPKPDNKYRDAFVCTCCFPDESSHSEIGEASNETTKKGISSSYKLTMAHKRGNDKAFLRSNYIGFFDVFSEEEADEFKKPQPKLPFTGKSLKYVSLLSDDEKYPNTPLFDIWMVHKDKEYIEKLTKHSDPLIRMVANVMVTRINEETEESINETIQ